MSVLIKGKALPKCCGDCWLARCVAYSDYCRVLSVDINVIDPTYKHPNCPLVEVSEPHGDLIDRDALVKDLTNGIKAGLLLDGYEKYQNINDMDDCVECVKYTDAVIEAEGSENHDD